MTDGEGTIESRVGAYYASKLDEHGATPNGVDWNSVDSQEARFIELARFVEPDHSVLDIGCGYGALLSFLQRTGNWRGKYVGYDIADEMIGAARSIHGETGENVAFTAQQPEPRSADFVIGSGLFNVKFDVPTAEWVDYIDRTLELMFDQCRVGMSFNMLTSYSDAHRMRADLFYARASEYFDLCASRFSRRVTLCHDYDLYEFTISVRRPQ